MERGIVKGKNDGVNMIQVCFIYIYIYIYTHTHTHIYVYSIYENSKSTLHIVVKIA
jgi:hypothetical protein